MLPKDYINYKLTGVHACDYSDASGMLLLDVKNKCWSQEMLDICSINNEQLPKLFESYEVIGNVKSEIADELGIILFSSPFDLTSIDFLEEMNVPAYKVASSEINDIPFIRKIARTGKPIIISTGIAYMEDIERALRACKEEGNENVILLKCSTAYPAPYEEINLKVIPNMKETFDCISGLSDHTMGCAVSCAAVALGAKVIEKHLTLRRSDGGVDSAFSMEPEEFREMVDNVRMIEKALGKVTYELTEKQKKSRKYSRSLFVAQDMKAGDVFTPENLRSVRPGCGLHTMYYEDILGKKITKDAKLGTPISWDLVEM
jgi:pseudaminic acid synthase